MMIRIDLFFNPSFTEYKKFKKGKKKKNNNKKKNENKINVFYHQKNPNFIKIERENLEVEIFQKDKKALI